MGEHKHNPNAGGKKFAVISDLDEAGKILATETTYCDLCGEPFPMWPPELLNEHIHEKHPETFWPQTTGAWEAYKSDTDLARRQNWLTQYRIQFLFLALQRRADLYQKCIEAGVIAPPRQG